MIIHRYNKHIYVYIRMLLHTDISHIRTYANKQHVHTQYARVGIQHIQTSMYAYKILNNFTLQPFE